MQRSKSALAVAKAFARRIVLGGDAAACDLRATEAPMARRPPIIRSELVVMISAALCPIEQRRLVEPDAWRSWPIKHPDTVSVVHGALNGDRHSKSLGLTDEILN
jgi:hypothetical protein